MVAERRAYGRPKYQSRIDSRPEVTLVAIDRSQVEVIGDVWRCHAVPKPVGQHLTCSQGHVETQWRSLSNGEMWSTVNYMMLNAQFCNFSNSSPRQKVNECLKSLQELYFMWTTGLYVLFTGKISIINACVKWPLPNGVCYTGSKIVLS